MTLLRDLNREIPRAPIFEISSNLTLNSSSPRLLVVNPTTTGLKVLMPSAGVRAGDIFEIHNRTVNPTSSSDLSLRTADDAEAASSVTLGRGFMKLIALTDNPATGGAWGLLNFETRTLFTGAASEGGTGANYSITRYVSGSNRLVVLSGWMESGTASLGSLVGVNSTAILPAVYRPPTQIQVFSHGTPADGFFQTTVESDSSFLRIRKRDSAMATLVWGVSERRAFNISWVAP